MTARRISNAALPGWTELDVLPRRGELGRRAVFGPDGTPAGHVVYVARPGDRGTAYGWRPVGGRSLSSLVDAVRRLAR